MSSILPINLNAITPLISTWLYSTIRISSFFITTPFFSQLAIPNYFKVIMTLAIAFVLSPIIQHNAINMPFIFSGVGLFYVFQEMLIGIAMGVIIKITFEVLNLAGQMVGTSMQLNFAAVYSPADHAQTNVLGSFYQIFGMLIFISMHGPIILLSLLCKSFIAMPMASTVISNFQIKSIIIFSQNMFLFGLLLSLPIMITLMVLNIGMAVISRLSSALNIFTVGFPVVILGGIATLIVSLPPSLHYFAQILKNAIDFILQWQAIK